MPPATPSEIAAAALDHWQHKLPAHKGKPRASEEWTVYAAIIATKTTTSDSNRITVVSCATGTKCTAVPPANHGGTLPPTADAILHDSHAEVLARRGLLRVLWQEIAKRSSNIPDNNKDTTFLLTKIPNSHRYQLREDVQLHLYVSDSPCGDASIYSLDTAATASGGECHKRSSRSDTISTAPKAHKNNNNGLQFTGAKVIVSQETKVSVQDCGGGSEASLLQDSRVARERVQLLGRLRTKSGRSNLQAHQRSDSLSCSDKIVRWCVLGLQGRALLHYLNEPIRLSTIIVSRDIRNHYHDSNTGAQWKALHRSIPNRIVAVQEELRKGDGVDLVGNDTQELSVRLAKADTIDVPKVHVVEQMFVQGKACSEHVKEMASRKRKHGDDAVTPKLSPTGVCLNWNMCDDSIELTVGARGIRQGKKPKTEQDIFTLASRLSRFGIWKSACSISSAATYSEAKSSETRQRDWRSVIFRRGPLAGWMEGGDQDSPTAENETAAPQYDAA
eukprot:scaffold1793_cov173-Amphora_coffeaeformis.AAC.11